jgi:hypothetical protein
MVFRHRAPESMNLLHRMIRALTALSSIPPARFPISRNLSPLRSRARAGVKAVLQSPQRLRKADHSSFLIASSLDIHAPQPDHGRKQNTLLKRVNRNVECRDVTPIVFLSFPLTNLILLVQGQH